MVQLLFRHNWGANVTTEPVMWGMSGCWTGRFWTTGGLRRSSLSLQESRVTLNSTRVVVLSRPALPGPAAAVRICWPPLQPTTDCCRFINIPNTTSVCLKRKGHFPVAPFENRTTKCFNLHLPFSRCLHDSTCAVWPLSKLWTVFFQPGITETWS